MNEEQALAELKNMVCAEMRPFVSEIEIGGRKLCLVGREGQLSGTTCRVVMGSGLTWNDALDMARLDPNKKGKR